MSPSEVEESAEEPSEDASNSDIESDWEIYDRDFSPRHFKDANVGPDFQIIDPMPDVEPLKPCVDLSAEVWNPNKISSDNLGKNQH